MKKTLLLLALALLSINTFGQMVLEYEISTANTEIVLPLYGTVNVSINWGDSSAIETVNTPTSKAHKYTSIGVKTVTITGILTQFGSYTIYHGPTLTKVLSWDGLGLTSLSYAFNSAILLTSVPGMLPSSVTDLSYMFSYASSFNQPIGTWNTQNVTNMSGMFNYAEDFNQPIGTWNTTNVTDMSGMFSGANYFNQPNGNWNTARVKYMYFMFYGATAFNQPIGTWNTANVTDMSYMFWGATSFNQPIGNWYTANVTDMSIMFGNATSFNQPIGTWNITKVTNMSGMFFGDTLCAEIYDKILNGWAAQAVQTGVSFDGGGSKYSAAASAARANLVSKGWTIKDQGQGLSGNCDVTELEDQTTIDAPSAVYPNPATSEVHSTSFAQLYDVTGKLVAEGQGKIDVSLLPRGIYILKSENRTTKIVLR